jgi:PAS domain S-box-containing protein
MDAGVEQPPQLFLKDGGEMGHLISAYDWSKTSIGNFDQWPPSLQTTLGIILHSDFPMFLWWGEEMIQFYNDAYRPSLGNHGKHPKALGQKAKDCWPEIWGIIFPLIQQVRISGESFFSEDQLIPIYRNGQIENVYWTFSYSPVIENTGKIEGVLVVCTETTKKVEMYKEVETARKKLEQSETNLRNMILQSPVAMCILKGPSLTVEIANEKILEIWGKRKEEVMLRPLFEGIPEARAQGLEDVLQKVLQTGERFVAVERPVNLLRNGKLETKYINFLYEAFRGGDSAISGLMAVAIEVTEQVIARQKIEDVVAERTQELAETNKSLKYSNSELAQFAYIASHDLQEPARKIKTFASILQKNLHDIDARSTNYLNKIVTSSDRMLALVRDVLTFSQLSKQDQLFTKINLNEVVQDAISDFELLIEETGAVVISKDLPTIEGFPVQIRQLFGNLISNSLKFISSSKTPIITIESTLLSSSDIEKRAMLNPAMVYYDILFRDNGIGFNQANAEQIFEIFQRLHIINEYSGTGIGLAMCKKIAQNHNGDIYAESVLDKGAIFHVVLPKSQI